MEFSETGLITDVICQAFTDAKDQLRYLAGNGAVGIYTKRPEEGTEVYKKT